MGRKARPPRRGRRRSPRVERRSDPERPDACANPGISHRGRSRRPVGAVLRLDARASGRYRLAIVTSKPGSITFCFYPSADLPPPPHPFPQPPKQRRPDQRQVRRRVRLLRPRRRGVHHRQLGRLRRRVQGALPGSAGEVLRASRSGTRQARGHVLLPRARGPGRVPRLRRQGLQGRQAPHHRRSPEGAPARSPRSPLNSSLQFFWRDGRGENTTKDTHLYITNVWKTG